MLFNLFKCKVMYITKSNKNSKTSVPRLVYTMKNGLDATHELVETKSERDLGIQITQNLKWNEQAKVAALKANSVLGTLKRAFQTWTCETVKTLYCSYVRPHLEYASSA